jgi:hypothetical protein
MSGRSAWSREREGRVSLRTADGGVAPWEPSRHLVRTRVIPRWRARQMRLQRSAALPSLLTFAALDAEEDAATELAARRSIAFIARTSIVARRSDRDGRRLGARWRTHAPCRLRPAARTRRPCAAAPWVSSRSSSARICFSSPSETRLRLTYSPQPGHVPRFPAHEKRQPQKQATSISDWLPRPAVRPGGRVIWSLASMSISVRPGSALASGVHDVPIAGADQSVIRPSFWAIPCSSALHGCSHTLCLR